MKKIKNLTIIIIILLALVAFYMGHKRAKRLREKINEPNCVYILKTDLSTQKVNYIFPFSPNSRSKSIFVDASQTEDIQKISPSSIDYLIREKADDYTVKTPRKKAYPIVLGDGEVSFWPLYKGLKPPVELELGTILAISWTPEGLEKAKKDPLVLETLERLEMTAGQNQEPAEESQKKSTDTKDKKSKMVPNELR